MADLNRSGGRRSRSHNARRGRSRGRYRVAAHAAVLIDLIADEGARKCAHRAADQSPFTSASMGLIADNCARARAQSAAHDSTFLR
jgi:hypothetical protein